jgi:hypothetical protein
MGISSQHREELKKHSKCSALDHHDGVEIHPPTLNGTTRKIKEEFWKLLTALGQA